jgi:hypothetical protein
VSVVTGHSDGTIALWGLLFPANMTRDGRLVRNMSEDVVLVGTTGTCDAMSQHAARSGYE